MQSLKLLLSGFIRFPLYYHMKFAFLVWLQLPSVDVSLNNFFLPCSILLVSLSFGGSSGWSYLLLMHGIFVTVIR